MKISNLIFILLISLSSLSFAQTNLSPASQEALALSEAYMQQALETYEKQYPDLALWKQATAQAKEAIRLEPGVLVPLRQLAIIYSRSNWYGPAFEAWQSFLNEGGQLDSEAVPLFAAVSSELGYTAYQQNRLDDALQYYLTLIDIIPYDKEGFVWAGRILLETEKPAQAIAYWQTVTERDATDERAKYFLKIAKAQAEWGIKAATAFEEGITFYNQADLQAARERFARAVAENEDYAEAWAWLGRVEFEQTNYSEASQYYAQANSLEPSNETYAYFLQESRRLNTN